MSGLGRAACGKIPLWETPPQSPVSGASKRNCMTSRMEPSTSSNRIPSSSSRWYAKDAGGRYPLARTTATDSRLR